MAKYFESKTVLGEISVLRIKKGNRSVIRLELPESLVALLVDRIKNDILGQKVEEEITQGEFDE